MVALVALLNEFKKLSLTDYEIANLVYLIERKELRINGWLQDQYAATFEGFIFIKFYKHRVIVNPLRISQHCINELEYNLLPCYTGKARLSDHIIEDRTKRYEQAEKEAL